MIALIPCRAGSKRIPNKNFRDLGGKPLWQWTYEAAAHSQCFDEIVICTNPEGSNMLVHQTEPGVLVQEHPLHRDDSRDIEWITDALGRLPASDDYMLLRPTSPFRDARTIQRSHEQWEATKDRLDSLRAMRRASEHAYKQWIVEDEIRVEPCNRPEPVFRYRTMVPITTAAAKKHLHSMPTQSLTEAYIQTAGLEVFHAQTIHRLGTLAGDQVGMFLVEGPEALDINSPADWEEAERLLQSVR